MFTSVRQSQQGSFSQGDRKSPLRQQMKSSQKLGVVPSYQPRLIQHLIDSSDDQQNDSFLSDDCENLFEDNSQQQRFRMANQNDRKQINRLYQDESNYQKAMNLKASHTNLTDQTSFSMVSKKSQDIFSNRNNMKPTQQKSKSVVSANSLISNSNRSTVKLANNQESSDSLFSQKQKQKSSPSLQIIYDTLKLSEYDSKQANLQQQTFTKNMKQTLERNFASKTKVSKYTSRENFFNQQNQSYESKGVVDSLQEMKKTKLNKKNIDVSSTPSSRIKFLQQFMDQKQKDNQQDNNQQLRSQYQSKVQQLNQELKRSKDVIKTLGLKNSHLQKTLEMKNAHLQELEIEKTNRQNSQIKQEEYLVVEREIYDRIGQYMKDNVRQFMEQIKSIKMNPLLQQNLQHFLANLLQLNSLSVNNKLGISKGQFNIEAKIKPQSNPKQHRNNVILTKSILNDKAPSTINDSWQEEELTQKPFKNKFHTISGENKHVARSHAFMNDNVKESNLKNRQGTTVRLDLSSNKQNVPFNKEKVTPNKRPNADEEFRLLEKSLQKLKNMEKQLQTTSVKKSPQTPVPKRKQTNILQNKSQFNYNEDDDQKSEYSIINRSYLSGLTKNQNSVINVRNDNSIINVSSSNLDRSKSRRKKIFA